MPPTPERLMRSRYTAFVRLDAEYLLRTWHPNTRPQRLDFDPHRQWTGLTILATTGGTLFETTGTVEFQADYLYRGMLETQREHSQFLREINIWFYLGEV